MQPPIDWYTITKDIILPSLTLFATVIIGIFIAIILKRKEEKGKIKAILIDTYMLYLNTKVRFFVHECNSFKFEILKDIYINYGQYFPIHSNYHIATGVIGKRRDEINSELKSNNQEETNWSPFTYRFAFLLTKKAYDKRAQKLEDNIVNNYMGQIAREGFINRLKSQIKSNDQIVKNMSSADINKIQDSLDKIEDVISISYNDFQFKIFNLYDTTIANMIDKY